MSEAKPNTCLNILCLDGGGAKGFYTLGFLRELEAAAGQSLATFCDAIYGTSTGAIIASLIGLGKTVSETLKLYEEHVPTILAPPDPAAKSAALEKVADELFKETKWTDFRPYIGVVATNWTREKPLIFKNRVQAAHGMKSTFVPGFGQSVSAAVRASCSATPFFVPCNLNLPNDGEIEARDGGFCANNPALFALADALNPMAVPAAQIRLLSLGVGHYPEPKLGLKDRLLRKVPSVHLLQKTLNITANTAEIQTRYLFPNVPQMRVSDRFENPELAMDFLERDLRKLNLLIQRGRESFAQRENQLRDFFNEYGKS